MNNIGAPRTLNAKNGKRERLTVSNTVKQLTSSAYTVAGSSDGKRAPRLASGAIIQVFTDSIYFTMDGTDPSSTVGFEVAPLDVITLETPQQLKDFKAIRKTADATIEVLYLFGT
jgi:hypothetical protein